MYISGFCRIVHISIMQMRHRIWRVPKRDILWLGLWNEGGIGRSFIHLFFVFKLMCWVVWENLKTLATSIHEPWLSIRDFNAIVSREESTSSGGANTRRYKFARWINDLELIDLSFAGNPFTWVCGNNSATRIAKRLDRGLANITWRMSFQ